jgi:hypothetical protein
MESMTKDRKTGVPRRVGRPGIGPKAQAHVPPEQGEYVAAEAEARGVDKSVIWRELIDEGYRLQLRKRRVGRRS